ncbi:hypothetical protein [Sphaerisporangium fuscum]|uniref:hypothetical protein n=1 Tax=Sphaerisporangium fuscum TaxID=2835868 RepID=UPI003FD7EDD0
MVVPLRMLRSSVAAQGDRHLVSSSICFAPDRLRSSVAAKGDRHICVEDADRAAVVLRSSVAAKGDRHHHIEPPGLQVLEVAILGRREGRPPHRAAAARFALQ